VTDSDREDHSPREMAERIEKELLVTQRLLNIAKLYQRTTWPGERAAAAEAFARTARGTRGRVRRRKSFCAARGGRVRNQSQSSNQDQPVRRSLDATARLNNIRTRARAPRRARSHSRPVGTEARRPVSAWSHSLSSPPSPPALSCGKCRSATNRR
jgi:hypothetical protein